MTQRDKEEGGLTADQTALYHLGAISAVLVDSLAQVYIRFIFIWGAKAHQNAENGEIVPSLNPVDRGGQWCKMNEAAHLKACLNLIR